MGITVYGASDDLIEVDGDIREEFPWQAPGYGQPSGDFLAFSDGTVLRIAFDPDSSGNWRITPLAHGAAKLTITQTADEESTDRADLDGDITWVVQGIGWAKR
jgi:hypothetical protein